MIVDVKNTTIRRVKIDFIERILNLEINIKAMLFRKKLIGQLACSYSPKRDKMLMTIFSDRRMAIPLFEL